MTADAHAGTMLTAKGMSNAVSVLAVTERGAMYDPSAVFYMDKIVTGPAAADVVDISAPVAENVRRVARAKEERPEDVIVVILDRPRHAQLVADVRAAGARIVSSSPLSTHAESTRSRQRAPKARSSSSQIRSGCASGS